MNETFLDNIIQSTRERIAKLKASTDTDSLRSLALEVRKYRPSYRLREALGKKDSTNVIAEIKRASPSKGVINDGIDIAEQARNYEQGGACAISVLTEEHFFKGSLDDLRAARSAVDLPLLRKDFTIDEIQIFEAAVAGADAVLLIVATLTPQNLRDFQTLVHELGMDAIIEVHTAEELEIASQIGAHITGVNNRDLETFEVSLDVSRDLIKRRPEGSLIISESGISSRKQIDELRAIGFDGFLVGESLMRASGSKQMLEALI
jgi:indole-3-glycerol phosphate synthase